MSSERKSLFKVAREAVTIFFSMQQMKAEVGMTFQHVLRLEQMANVA